MALTLIALAGACRTVLAPGPAHEPVTFESLLLEMTDRAAVARLPGPAYTCGQASSYDRDSVAPDEPGWFANWDRSQFLRSETNDGRDEHVMLDADGPGVIVRFWGTWHGAADAEFSNGTLRIYLDHDPEPVIVGPIADVLSGGLLIGAPLSQYVSKTCPEANRAHICYVPIPYAQHCKITYETSAPIERGAREGEALYYQINFRTYAAGTHVETFTPTTMAYAVQTVERTQTAMIAPSTDFSDTNPTRASERTLAPGVSAVIRLTGPAAIVELQLTIDAEDRAQAARSTVLEIAFDGETTIWAPIEAFFGCGPDLDPYRSWYVDVAEDGTLTSRWVMPFREGARITLQNLGTQRVTVRQRLTTRPWTWDERSMHFHATWNPRFHVTTGASSNEHPKARDMPYVHVDGRGVYVGDSLHVFNAANAWWGEGDEKIRVDGERFPSHFGTGTEDYYGYAWSRPDPFDAPFHAQPRGDGNPGPGASVNVRHRALDAIPFERSLDFDMELWHWQQTQVHFAPTSLWYARPGAKSDVSPNSEAARRPIAREAEDVTSVH